MDRDELILMPPASRDGLSRLEAELRRSESNPLRLWFDVPAASGSRVTDRADPFVLAFAFPMMQARRPVHVRGRVSPSLLAHLDEFMAVWQAWRPDRYQVVDLTAESEVEGPAGSGTGAIQAFSGGLDSCYTAWHHHRKDRRRRAFEVRAGLFVHGFDIPLDAGAAFAGARRGNERMLGSLGMECIPIATNFRELPAEWGEAHGTALAAALALFQESFGAGLIASTFPYDLSGIRWGSTPFTDRLLSSDRFAIVSDGADADRLAKAKAIAAWPEAMEHLRVCWQGAQPDRNCCVCEKCLRTLLTFRIAGVPRPASFAQDATDDQVRALRLPQPGAFEALCRLLDQAETAGFRGCRWFAALETAVVESACLRDAADRRREIRRRGSVFRRLLRGVRPGSR
jgi:hypothetical protein